MLEYKTLLKKFIYKAEMLATHSSMHLNTVQYFFLFIFFLAFTVENEDFS